MKFKRYIKKAELFAKKYSPEILMGVGVVCTAVGTVMACKATTKIDDVLTDSRETVDKIHTAVEKIEAGEEIADYSIEDSKKDLTITYVQSGLKMAKLYAPSVITSGMGIACMLTANNILKKRNLALAATATALADSFKGYRERVVDRFGKDIDHELLYNVKAVDKEETIVNDKGKEKTVKKKVEAVTSTNDFTRVFKAGNPNWSKSMDYNRMFLRGQQSFANEKLCVDGYLFLNDVLEELGFERTPIGQIVGWVYDDLTTEGDGYVDFDVHETYEVDDNGIPQPVFTLEFNVDGSILELM